MRGSEASGAVDLHASLVGQLDNCADFWEGFGRVREDPDGARWFRSGVDLPEINGVRRPSNLDVAAEAARVRSALQDVPWTWWVAEDGPPHTEDALHELGFLTVERMPHLAIDTRAAVTPAPPDLQVHAIAAHDVGEFVHQWVANFGIPSEYSASIAQREHERPLRDRQCTYLAGFIDGRMVATTLLLSAHGVAGIYCVTVDRRFRGRGIGRAMTSAAIAAAREQELPVASLQATPDGLPLYRSMGFEEISSYAILTIAPPPDDDADR